MIPKGAVRLERIANALEYFMALSGRQDAELRGAAQQARALAEEWAQEGSIDKSRFDRVFDLFERTLNAGDKWEQQILAQGYFGAPPIAEC